MSDVLVASVVPTVAGNPQTYAYGQLFNERGFRIGNSTNKWRYGVLRSKRLESRSIGGASVSTINSQKERGRKYAQAMERLLGSDSSRDLDRGMTHFERAVGLAGGGVNVTVDNRRQTAILNQPTSFEEVMDRVRAKLVAEQREQRETVAPENS